MHSWVPSKLLDEQLPAERYTRGQVANLLRLDELGAVTLGDLIDRKKSNYGVLPPSDVYVSAHKGVGLVRGGDLQYGHVRSPEVFAPNSFATGRSTLAKDDMLILAKGACIDGPAGVGLVTEERVGQIFNGTSYRVRCISIDPAYLAAYCMTTPFLLQKRREISNTGVSYNSESAIHAFRVLAPNKDAQAYIGSKVRQAEVLRERAGALESAFLGAVGVDVARPGMKARLSRVLPATIGADLNPGRYDPDRLAVRRALESQGGQQVGTFARIHSPTAEPQSAAQVYIGLDGISSTSIELAAQTVEAAEVNGTSRLLVPGPAISKLRPYLNKVAYIPASLGGALGSTELLCVSPRDLHPAYVYGVLKLETTVRQLNPVATGATHPRVTADDVLDVIVPLHPDHERLGESLEEAQECYSFAWSLTTAARLLVEALIERRVTDAELVAAQRDPAADRALLARITVAGVDTPSAHPLIEDVDRLLELIAAAQQREAA